MKEENTEGIDAETTTKESYNTNKTTKETKLLDLRAGFVQHTSPHQNARAPTRTLQNPNLLCTIQRI
jgi:hypothetical protein